MYTTGFVRQNPISQTYNTLGSLHFNVAPSTLKLPKHEVSFQCALLPNSVMIDEDYVWNSDNFYGKIVPSVSPWDRLEDKDIYRSYNVTSYLMSGSYFYALTNKIQVGAISSIRYHEKNWHYALTGKKYDTLSELFFGIVPTIRFNYVATKYFRAYVGVGISLMLVDREADFGKHRTAFASDVDIAVLGFSLGNRFFVGFEAGYLASGYAKWIVGFRF